MCLCISLPRKIIRSRRHSPEKVVINKHQAAKHSLGIRHSEFVAPLLIAIADV